MAFTQYAALTILVSSTLGVLSYVAYNLCFHPLAEYPGPWPWRAFRFPMLKAMMAGDLPKRIAQLHQQYGPVVRTAPDELSFIQPGAWRDIYQRRDFHRPPQWRGKPPGVDADSLVQADAPTHARLRRAFAPAFSDQAVRSYESGIYQHIDELVVKLHHKADESTRSGASVDVVKWLSFCLWDTTMDIGWGSSFVLLQKEESHPWITVVSGMKALLAGVCLAYYEPLGSFAQKHMPKEARDSLSMVLGTARSNVEQRLKLKTDRQDIFAKTLGKHNDLASAGLTQEEMVANSMNYIIAGSDSVVTVLSGALHHLLEKPSCLKLLTQEIRLAFSKSSDISSASTGQLPYLNAVIREAMRLCPTIPDGMRREVPEDGVTICGKPIPAGTIVSVATLAAFTSPANFDKPSSFEPERWLSEPVTKGGLSSIDYPDDNKDAYQPFSYGPRNCIGQNLAWLEMRLFLARLVFEFDFGEPEAVENKPWSSQSIYWLWEKQSLRVTLAASKK